MIIGTYTEDNVMHHWYLSQIEVARERLRRFPVTNGLLEGFANYETKTYEEAKNVFFLRCISTIDGRPNPEYLRTLARFFLTALQHFGNS